MGMVPGSVDVALKWPITVDGAELNTLTIRRPKARDQMSLADQADKPRQAETQLLADLCEQTLETILDLDFEDYMTLKDTYVDFLPKSIQLIFRASESESP